MIKRDQPYKRQMFICISNRHGDSPSCGHGGSEEMVEELKNMAKEMKLKASSASQRAAAWTSALSVPT